MKNKRLVNILNNKLEKFNKLYLILYNRRLFVENLYINLKITILLYEKIYKIKKNKTLIFIICILKLQKILKDEHKKSKYNSVKTIYMDIININDNILQFLKY